MRWQTGDLQIAGIPATFWLTDGSEVPATFTVSDPDAVEWDSAAFIGRHLVCQGRLPLAEALSAAMQASGIILSERQRLLDEFAQLMD